jgi:heme oxygenase
MSAIAELRSATWPSHQSLEKKLDVKARFGSVSAYRAHLERMWGFCADLEPQLEQQLSKEALPDYGSRRKLPLLMQDLATLGADRTKVLSLPRCQGLPHCPDPATAFGCAYVLEGATLGGRTLLPLVQDQLGFTSDRGAAFLASYGEKVTPMWQSFGMALDEWCSIPEHRLSAARAAVGTFDALREWLCEESP